MLPYSKGRVKITSPFGPRVLNGISGDHKGIDMVGLDSKNIVAAADGTVVRSRIVYEKSNPTWQWGNYVAIQDRQGRVAYYCHLSARLVEQGQKVRAGQAVGIEGSTGYSTGSHLHFELREGNKSINPAAYLGIGNTTGVFNACSADYASLVAERCGLEQRTVDYINKYAFAADLWRKLYEQMPR